MTNASSQDTIINYRTKKALKDAFFSLCREQNVSATSRLNDYMRSALREAGKIDTPTPKKKTQTVSDWRDDLLRA